MCTYTLADSHAEFWRPHFNASLLSISWEMTCLAAGHLLQSVKLFSRYKTALIYEFLKNSLFKQRY